MSKVSNLVLALAMCLPCLVLAAPSDEGGSSFIDQGKFAIGIETFSRTDAEVERDGPGTDYKADVITGNYAFDIGYMVIPALQLRLGYSLQTSETKFADSDSSFEDSETSIEPGFRYYFQASPILFPFATFTYALTTEESDDSDESTEGTEMRAGGGLLVALGGGQGGFAAASVEYVSSETTFETEYSSGETTRTFGGLRTQLILGLYF